MERRSDNAVQTFEGEESPICMDGMGQKERKHCNGAGQKSKTIEDCIEAYTKFGSISKAATALGISNEHLRKRLKCYCRNQGIPDVRLLRGDVEQPVTQSFLVQLIAKQNYRCAISGIELTPEMASLDHIIPVSKGGEHVVDNVVWVHAEINRMKGQLSMEQFIAFCNKVIQYSR